MCAVSPRTWKMEPSIRQTQHSSHTPATRASHAGMYYHAGMHLLREEGFQGVRARSIETGEQYQTRVGSK